MSITVPAAAAAVWCSEHRTARDAAASCLVMVGERPEVCLDKLSQVDPAAAGALDEWWAATRELWSAARADRLAGRAWLRSSRTLVDDVQLTAKKDKRDLVEAFTALTAAGPTARLITEATAADPDFAMLRARAKALGGSLVVHDQGTSATLTMPLAGTLWWPNALGGPAWPGEVSREVTVLLRYAAWRDRRVRRLAAVKVSVVEMWADPDRFGPRNAGLDTAVPSQRTRDVPLPVGARA